ncbi:amidohydrolase family protein [Microbaculum marinum]|uniref:Amidohydrolase family protein n=1 Tax=Microbaculum marinum TaxID=1764581 RepID=A0AAW9RLA2_9HYPH
MTGPSQGGPAAADGAPEPCDLLIVNGCVLTMDGDRTIYRDGAIAIRGRDIVAVGPRREIEAAWTAERRLDARGGTVHPGFIDGHYHAGLHLCRGSITDDPNPPKELTAGGNLFARWINALTDEDEYASALMASSELVLNGYTGFVDAATSFSPDAIVAGAEAVGIRSSVSDCMLWDLVGGEPMAAEVPRAPCDGERCRREMGGQLHRNADPDALARGHVALYGAGSATEELMREAKTLADREGVVFHQHQSIVPEDAAYDRERFGGPPLVRMLERGLIGENSVFTHMNILDPAEVDAVAESGMALVWHPGNLMYYSISQSAKSAFPTLYRRGTSVAFGTDIAKAWAFGDLGFIAYLVSREWNDYLPSEAILEMFTLGGAQAIGMADRLGAIAPGRRADIVIRTSELPDAQPNMDVVRQLMQISRTKGVHTVLCNGEVVVRGGRLVRTDESEIYAIARRSAERMAERAGTMPIVRWPTVD